MTEKSGCSLCDGFCPDCGGDVGDAAGSLRWVLCSSCHVTFIHDRCARREVDDETL